MAIPSLAALRAFEMMVQTGSVREAARELNVVHGAVSQQLRTLEKTIGTQLFDRKGKRLELNEQGRRYAMAVNVAMGILEKAGNEISSVGNSQTIRIGMRPGFAANWFIPKVSKLDVEALGAEIEIVTEAEDRNLQRKDLDAMIVGGDYEPRPNVSGRQFMPDVFGPVCAAAVAQDLDARNIEASMSAVTGLVPRNHAHLWETWFYEAGIPSVHFKKRMMLDSVLMTIEAIRAGLGIGVIPTPLVDEELKNGALVAPFGVVHRTGGYYFCCRENDANSPKMLRIYRWLCGFSAPQVAPIG